MYSIDYKKALAKYVSYGQRWIEPRKRNCREAQHHYGCGTIVVDWTCDHAIEEETVPSETYLENIDIRF